MPIARSTAALMLSNYPYAFSNQIPTTLSIYLFMLLVGRPISTGTLYIALMIMLAVASVPGSLRGHLYLLGLGGTQIHSSRRLE